MTTTAKRTYCTEIGQVDLLTYSRRLFLPLNVLLISRAPKYEIPEVKNTTQNIQFLSYSQKEPIRKSIMEQTVDVPCNQGYEPTRSKKYWSLLIGHVIKLRIFIQTKMNRPTHLDCSIRANI
jgi:hypothetical protein